MTNTLDDVTAREIALATSGLSTLDNTLEQDAILQTFLREPYPARDDTAGWAARRSAGPLADPSETAQFGVTVTDVEVDGVPCRVIEPPSAQGDYLHLHGGGWSLGSHRFSDERLAELARDSGLRVTTVGYPMAPEHQLPEIIDSCRTVARTLTADAGLWAIGGESAGAHLAATTLLGLRDAGLQPFSAAVLTYGVYDLFGTPGRLAARGAEVRRLADIVLPDADEAALRDSAFSPLFADLTGLPPARFLCGTRDALLEDTLMMEARWRYVATTELDLVAAADHAFTLMPGPTTQHARRAEAAFLRRMLTGSMAA